MTSVSHYGRVKPLVHMEPTALRTVTTSTIGTPSAAISLVPRSKTRFQRVVIAQEPDGTRDVFISRSAGELEIPGQAVPGGAYLLPLDTSRVFVIQPGDSLFGASDLPAQVSIAISEDIGVPLGMPPGGAGLDASMFRAYALPVLGTEAIRVVSSGVVPRRVVITTAIPGTFVSDIPSNLSGPSAVPGRAFAALPGLILLLAPNQALYAAGPIGSSIEVTVSDVYLPHVAMGDES